ncbi:Wzz/FepE/Etk N-terminal domain-containing protein [Sansalvadorimonas sp. 2012CJ34-2]|uniref:Wzz/FepE/Etk N-terminal domain-containing protein n=1 Tax=Parendozoicomonas callyspongiae TaxID=2942213 RepID=A0ABT0PKB5_9GAMM|nr:Wzz/FepE/Etk N-terminal domain-containing protein [Sansalvadorimonas sp. 2012CJ34-2]
MSTPNYAYQYPQDDEIDLFELVEKLWAKKWLIIGTTAIITMISVVVAFLLPPAWQSETKVYMSSKGDLGSYNDIQSHLATSKEILLDEKSSTNQPFPQLDPKELFNLFYRHLTSRSILRQVYVKSGLAKQITTNVQNKEQALSLGFSSFQDRISIERSGGTDTVSPITISYSADTPEASASLINDYLIPTAIERTRRELISNITTEIEGEITKIDKSMVLTENQFIEKSRLKTLKLEVALKIATAGDITRPVNLSASLLNDDDNSLFLLGTDLLKTQLSIQRNEILEYRMTSNPQPNDADKPLLPKVASLFIAKQSLKILDTSLSNLKPIIIDEPAQIPVTPIKPNKRLIVALGTVLGGMLSVFIALIQIAIAGRKEKQRATAAIMESSTCQTEKLTT